MFVTGFPGLKIQKNLVIADLHIGIEYELWKNGVSIPSQIDGLIKNILRGFKKTRSKRLIILGDIKHGVPTISKQEKREIPVFVQNLVDKFDVTLVKGNHDGRIERLVGDLVEISPFMILGDNLLTHGHKSIPRHVQYKKIIIGHNHPGIKFHDPVGVASVEQAWIIGPMQTKKKQVEKGRKSGDETTNKKIILMPAFNMLCGVTPMNETQQKDLLGPIAKKLVLNESDAYLLDGTHLGKIGDLRSV